MIKKGFVLGGLGLLSLLLIYHPEPAWWGPCCCRKKTTNSRCTQHPQNLCQGGIWSPSSCDYTNTGTHPHISSHPLSGFGEHDCLLCIYCANVSSLMDNYFVFKPLKWLSYSKHFYAGMSFFSVLLASFVLSCYLICRFTEITCQWNSGGGAVLFCPWIFFWNFSLWNFSFCGWRCSICLCIHGGHRHSFRLSKRISVVFPVKGPPDTDSEYKNFSWSGYKWSI